MNIQRIFALAALLTLGSAAQAVPITAVGVTGTGATFNNDLNLIIDGVVPAENTVWTASTNVWWTGFGGILTVDLGADYIVEDVLLSVDNNDTYRVTYAPSGGTLFNLLASFGEITPLPGGMDTMSSDSTHPEYVAGIDFAPVKARYLSIQAIGGDSLNAVGELRAFGRAVPEPMTGLLLCTALLASIGVHRRAN